MANPTGELKVKAGGKEYRLHLGMSVLADLQERFGDDFEALFQTKEGRMPNLKVLHEVILASLQRYHPDADRWVVDDIIAENHNVIGDVLQAAFPDPESGEAKGKKDAAA